MIARPVQEEIIKKPLSGERSNETQEEMRNEVTEIFFFLLLYEQ